MATVLLSAAGSAVGGAIGGSVLGIGAATLGKAAGAVAGSLIDQKILGQGSRAVTVGRARSLRIQGSSEGEPIPLTFGRMRVTGQIIWSTRYLERSRTTSRGGKGGGGQQAREYSYSISFAVGLCEGPIDRIGRVWADGKLLDPARHEMRIYRGTRDQLPDPKIEAVEGAGNVPAYRDLAYVVFEDFPASQFGNRIPQLSFEVYRSDPYAAATLGSDEAGRPLRELVKGVALAPGTGEFALDPDPVRNLLANGTAVHANVNNGESRADFAVSLDQLEAELPGCEAVSLVISWFGSDLRCGRCRVEPRIEERGRRSAPYEWSTTGLTTATAALISRDEEGRPNFGGSPSDRSVVKAIRELNQRGKKVMLYPFLLMDVPPGNALVDPYTDGPGQPVFPWRGRITLDTAPGRSMSADQTAAASDEVAAFFGTAGAADFATDGEGVSYSGPDEWGWRRFILHLASLARAAGGVDAICVGSELRGLMRIRSGRTEYPAVGQMRALAAEVRAVLPEAKISYAADWSEYFGHQPSDGSGDVIFNLDPLWADPNVDFVGVDDYASLADWRHSEDHLDAVGGAGSVYSLPYLRANVEGGENYDWYYGSEADRAAQARTVITDGAHGEDWIFRPKDLRGWWRSPHHNRIGGVREAEPTAWVPESKPIWLTEVGCPAVDLGANAPNVFYDGKSSESRLPFGSRGARDEEMQRRFLQAKLGYWAEEGTNPLSTLYGGRMIPEGRTYVWTWDVRPWPDFPVRESVWADGPSHRLGHWITGRVLSGALADVVAEICMRAGLAAVDVSGLYGVVHGFMIERASTAREALQPLMTTYGFDGMDAGGRLVFTMRGQGPDRGLELGRLADGEEPGTAFEETRSAAGGEADIIRLQYVQAESDYRLGAAESRRPGATEARIAETSLAISLPTSMAQATTDRWLAEVANGRVTASFRLPPSATGLEPGDIVTVNEGEVLRAWRIDRLTHGGAIEVEAARVDQGLYLPAVVPERRVEPQIRRPSGPVEAHLLDLPLADGTERDHRPWLAVVAEPWAGDMAVYASPGSDDFRLIGMIRRPAVMGTLLDALPAGKAGQWQRVEIGLGVADGSLASQPELNVLGGANRLAVEAGDGLWEILQFRDAVLTAPGTCIIGHLLRGQRGTEFLAEQPIPAGRRVVAVDDALFEVPLSLEETGLARRYRIGPAEFGYAHAAYVELVAAGQAAGLRPFALTALEAVPDPSGNGLRIQWIRRSRIGGDSWQLREVPLGEEAEEYEIRVRQAGVELRRDTVMATGFHYTKSMQLADGRSGPLEIAVAQLSSLYGAGPEKVIVSDD